MERSIGGGSLFRQTPMCTWEGARVPRALLLREGHVPPVRGAPTARDDSLARAARWNPAHHPMSAPGIPGGWTRTAAQRPPDAGAWSRVGPAIGAAGQPLGVRHVAPILCYDGATSQIHSHGVAMTGVFVPAHRRMPGACTDSKGPSDSRPRKECVVMHSGSGILESSLSRRHLVGGAAALGATLAVGGGRAVIAQDGSAEFHAAWPYQQPPTGHFNTFVTNGIMNPPNIYGDLITLPMGLFYWASEEWLPILATDWGFAEDGENFNVTLREGVVWSDGTDFSAQDVVTTFNCLRIMSNTVWQYIDEVTVVDDYNLTFHMANP